MSDTQLSLAVIGSAMDWWRSKRPKGWSPERHYFEWNIGCETKEEKALAKACKEFWTQSSETVK